MGKTSQVDFNDCVNDVQVTSLQYCSDQDEIHVTRSQILRSHGGPDHLPIEQLCRCDDVHWKRRAPQCRSFWLHKQWRISFTIGAQSLLVRFERLRCCALDPFSLTDLRRLRRVTTTTRHHTQHTTHHTHPPSSNMTNGTPVYKGPCSCT